MLVATSYRDFDVQRNKSPPKVISEVRKTYLNCVGPNLRPKLTGELFIKTPQDKHWHRRRTQIRGGQLHVSPVTPAFNEELPPLTAIKLPLRHLSLQAGPLAHSLILCKGQNVVLMLQTDNEQIFDEWVKTIAIELIRQTPLDAIKYLDILTLAECYNKTNQRSEQNYVICPQTYKKPDICPDNKKLNQRLHSIEQYERIKQTPKNVSIKNCNQDPQMNSALNGKIFGQNQQQNERLNECNDNSRESYINVLSKNQKINEETNLKKDCNQNILVDQVDSPEKRKCQPRHTSSQEIGQNREKSLLEGICSKNLQQPDESTTPRPIEQENLVESLLKKCQNSESYVPVKEKLVLFESLCKMGRKVRSTEDVSLKPETSNTKRAKSLHDLSSINTHIAVREICKYFENKSDHLGGTENKNVQKNSVVKRLNFEKCNSNTENLYKFHKVIVIS